MDNDKELQLSKVSVTSLLNLRESLLDDEIKEELDQPLTDVRDINKMVFVAGIYQDIEKEMEEKTKYYKSKAEQAKKYYEYTRARIRFAIGDEPYYLPEKKLIPQPYITRDVKPELVTPEEKKYAVTMDWSLFQAFSMWVTSTFPEAEWTNKEVIPTVSQLPENHPAIFEKSHLRSVQIKDYSMKDLKDANIRAKRLEASNTLALK